MEFRRVPKLGGLVSINKKLSEKVLSSTIDLSGAASLVPLFYADYPMRILSAKAIYTEASSADAGVNISVGKLGTTGYFVANTASEVSKAIGYEKVLTLANDVVETGDLITASCAGGKTGTGNVVIHLVLEGSNK